MGLSSKGKFLFWCNASEGDIGLVVIVGAYPSSGKFLNLVKGLKQMMGQPIVADRPVIALDISVLLWLAWLDESGVRPALGCSNQGNRADVFRSVVAADYIRFAASFDNPVERSDHALGWQRKIDLDAQSLAIVAVDDIEQPNTSPIGQLVMHEVDRPALVERRQYSQWQQFLAHGPMARLDP